MVSRRAVQRGAEARAVVAQQSVDDARRAAGRVQRGPIGALRDHGVGVQRAAPRGAHLLDAPHVAGRVHGVDHVELGRRARGARPTPATRARRARARWPRSAPAARGAGRCRAPAMTVVKQERRGHLVTVPAHGRPRAHRDRPGGRRRRRRGPLRRPHRGRHRRAGRARLRHAARADRELLGAGRPGGGARGGRLARPASRGHRARRARPRAHERGDRPVPRGARAPSATSSASACTSTPTATATSRSASRAVTRAGASSTPAAAPPAGASCASCPPSWSRRPA